MSDKKKIAQKVLDSYLLSILGNAALGSIGGSIGGALSGGITGATYNALPMEDDVNMGFGGAPGAGAIFGAGMGALSGGMRGYLSAAAKRLG